MGVEQWAEKHENNDADFQLFFLVQSLEVLGYFTKMLHKSNLQ